MNNLTLELSKAGLSGNESKIYLELLKNNNQSASEIAKKTTLDRTLSYTVLNNLIKKGLVATIIINNKKIFSASTPKNLLNPIKEKEIIISKLITKLNKIKEEEEENDYEIKVFEGKKGIRTVINQMFESEEVFSFGGTGKAYDLLFDVQAKIKNAEKNKLTVKIIFSKEFKQHKLNKIPWMQTKFLDLKSEATTTIFNDSIAIHLIKSKPIIILIKNKEIANSYKNHFEILWNQAK